MSSDSNVSESRVASPEHRNRFNISNSRVASPSPSIRIISNRRVINERSKLINDESSESVLESEYCPTITKNVESLTWNEILPYYLPCLSWINQYSLNYFIGDLIGGLTLVFFQLPLSLSYATTLAHVPVISGLYSLGISPLIYGVFGSCPQLIVGPESPISMVVGQAIEPLLHHKHFDPLEYVVSISFVSGATLLGFGLGRFGFLDNLLCNSLLKGFISAVGVVMIINALVVTLGLEKLMKEISNDPSQMDIHSPLDKVMFLLNYYDHYDGLTLKISLIGFLIIMSVRMLKKFSKKSMVVFIPEILLVVGGSTILCEIYDWNLKGIDIIGFVKAHKEIKLYNPLNNWPLIKSLSSAGFLCAMLGFFESTTASKSLGTRYDLPISSNRELIALGCINIIGSFFGSLPAFGGYGRSKVNAISAKTTMSGVIMGIFTLITIKFFLKYLYYVPHCMLSVVTAVIGISLIEEAPYEVYFNWKTKGIDELITFGITVFFTLVFSMEHGVFLGLIYSLIRLIRNSAESRIQILGRYPNTNTFVDADIPTSLIMEKDVNKHSSLNLFHDSYQRQINKQVIEEVEGCLIIKIPEPLTFTNSSDLSARLKRVELYGSTKAHPASKRSRDNTMNKYIIFDLKGMSLIDSSALKIMKDIIIGYRNRDIISFFVRVSSEQVIEKLNQAKIIDILLDNLRELNSNIEEPFFNTISDALRVIDCFENSNV